jgi:predicted dehydrogenase
MSEQRTSPAAAAAPGNPAPGGPAPDRLNIAVIGLGWWGRVIVPLAQSSTQLRVVKVAHSNIAAAEEFARAHNVDLVVGLEPVLQDPRVHAVVLCTPHTRHADQIVAAANAGKHVFCEKPLTLTRADALRAVAACEANKVVLAVGHERRFEPPIIEAMRLIHSGELGAPLQFEGTFTQDLFLSLPAGNWRLSGKEAPAGPMTATGVHMLDLAIAVFGEAHSAYASMKQLGSHLSNGDTLAALVNFKQGGHALISAILATPFAGRFAVYGSKGWVEVRDKTHPGAPEGWVLTRCERGGRAHSEEFAPAPGVLRNLEAFAAAATGRSPYPVSHGEMVANIAALEAIIRSIASGQVEAVEG